MSSRRSTGADEPLKAFSTRISPRIGAQTAALLATLFAIKVVGLLLDPSIHVFLGDSASYLHSAGRWWPPTDRSFVYPALIALVARSTHNLHGLIVAQSVCGVGAAWIAFAIARDQLGVRWGIAFVAACLLAVEPAQMFYERMVLTEAPSLLALCLMLLFGLRYVGDGHVWRLPALVALGLLAIAFRVSLLPFVWAFAVLVVVARYARKPFDTRRFARDMGLCLGLTVIMHGAYTRIYGAAAHVEPDYVVHAGAYRLGLVAPLVTPRELADAGAPPDLLQRVRPEPTYANREAQIWLEHGLINQLRSELDAQRADRVAYTIAALALRRHPVEFLLMQLRTLSGYFRPDDIRFRLNDDLGSRSPDEAMIAAVRTRYGYDLAQTGPRTGLFANAFGRSYAWLTACLFLLAPLGSWLAWRGGRENHRALTVFGLCCVGLVANDVLFSHIISYRYLHPFPFFFLVGTACAVDRLRWRRREPGPAASAG